MQQHQPAADSQPGTEIQGAAYIAGTSQDKVKQDNGLKRLKILVNGI